MNVTELGVRPGQFLCSHARQTSEYDACMS